MEKYEYYRKCAKTLNDLIEDLDKNNKDLNSKIEKNYSDVFYYLFIKENIYINKDIFDILDNVYEISDVHTAIILIWHNNNSYNLETFYDCYGNEMSRNDVIKTLKHLSENINKEIKRHEDEIKNVDKNSFINDLISACMLLQRNKDYYNKNENSRNDYLRDLMEFKGYLVKDQSRSGISQNGKEAGETDLIFCKTKLCNNIIVECMNLSNTSNNKTTIESHYKKLMTKYDSEGNLYNILISYVKSDDFIKTSLKYKEIIENYEFEYKTRNIESDLEFKDKSNEICVMKSEHLRNGNRIFIYHVLVHFTND